MCYVVGRESFGKRKFRKVKYEISQILINFANFVLETPTIWKSSRLNIKTFVPEKVLGKVKCLCISSIFKNISFSFYIKIICPEFKSIEPIVFNELGR